MPANIIRLSPDKRDEAWGQVAETFGQSFGQTYTDGTVKNRMNDIINAGGSPEEAFEQLMHISPEVAEKQYMSMKKKQKDAQMRTLLGPALIKDGIVTEEELGKLTTDTLTTMMEWEQYSQAKNKSRVDELTLGALEDVTASLQGRQDKPVLDAIMAKPESFVTSPDAGPTPIERTASLNIDRLSESAGNIRSREDEIALSHIAGRGIPAGKQTNKPGISGEATETRSGAYWHAVMPDFAKAKGLDPSKSYKIEGIYRGNNLSDVNFLPVTASDAKDPTAGSDGLTPGSPQQIIRDSAGDDPFFSLTDDPTGMEIGTVRANAAIFGDTLNTENPQQEEMTLTTFAATRALLRHTESLLANEGFSLATVPDSNQKVFPPDSEIEWTASERREALMDIAISQVTDQYAHQFAGVMARAGVDFKAMGIDLTTNEGIEEFKQHIYSGLKLTDFGGVTGWNPDKLGAFMASGL
jgi:hypothetical protein